MRRATVPSNTSKRAVTDRNHPPVLICPSPYITPPEMEQQVPRVVMRRLGDGT